MTDLTRLLADEMAALLRAGDVSSRELTEAHLAAAERDNRGLHAWLTIDRERALAEADAADARLVAARTDPDHALDSLRPLLGIPVALKDLVSVAGGQCTAGSRILKVTARHTTHTSRSACARSARWFSARRTWTSSPWASSTENSAFRPTGNPWDLSRVPGGRRAGRPLRCAADRAPSRSVPTPAARSASRPRSAAIVGLKPTYGRVSRYGLVAFASSLDQIGPFASDVRDAAALLHAIAGHDRDSTSSPNVPAP